MVSVNWWNRDFARLRWPEGVWCAPRAKVGGVGHSPRSVGLRRVCVPALRHRRDDLSGHALPLAPVVPRHLVVARQKTGASALGLQRVPGLGSYRTAWPWLHKLHRAMVRPGRERLAGRVEVDET